jgi:hypothetical protein
MEFKALCKHRVSAALQPTGVPFRDLVSRHARREAAREGIPMDEIEAAYLWPDDTRPSTHDDAREIRTRHVPDGAVEVVVDTIDGRVVTVWRRGGFA